MRWIIALGAVAAAAALRLALDPWLGDAHPYPLFLGAVIVAAWAGGVYPALAAALAALLVPSAARAGEIPNAVLVLEASAGTPGSDAAGAPPRFVLMKDGQAFVGGTSRVGTVRLEKAEAQALRRRADAARKAIGRAEGRVALGTGGPTVRLRIGEGPPVEVTLGRERPAPVAGQPAEPVSALVDELLAFHHAGLVPHEPSSYAMSLREGVLAGGCRPWTFEFPLAPSVGVVRVVTAEQASGWPTGALPASVCGDGGARYVMTLRPLLPGEQP